MSGTPCPTVCPASSSSTDAGANLAFAIARLAAANAVSDLQIILAGVFGLAGLAASCFGAMMKRRKYVGTGTKQRPGDCPGRCALVEALR